MLARRLQRSALPRLLARRAPLCSAASPIPTSAAAASGSAASADAPVPADAVDLRLATGPAPTRFAVLELGGTQYKVAPDDAICCLLYTSPSPRDRTRSRMPSSA